MTGASRDRILKDVNSNIGDHLHNHIHLANCIHLKNHIHKHSPVVNDRDLMRDLVVIQRSRSLKDPSASPRIPGDNVISWKVDHPQDGNDLGDHVVSRPFEFRETSVKEKGGSRQNRAHKSISDKLKEILSESDDAALSCNHDGVHARVGKIAEFGEANTRVDGKRVKRRKFRGERRNRPFVATTQNAAAQNEMSVASNSFSQGRDSGKYRADVTGGQGNVCGIPWNWSRIHHRGKKSVFDMSSSSAKSDGELSLPLLLDSSGSQGSRRIAFHHDYSGELGIFADNLLMRDTDSDLASEDRSEHGIQKQKSNSRHENLTQKYMPRKFGDLVGQTLVVQALSNAIMKRKVGLLYVFHGPHGTGKTTCARIFARALNCQSIESHRPCGCCDSCIAHEMGKSRNVTEIGPVSKIDFEAIIGGFDKTIASRRQSQYRVFIFDECDTFSSDCWSSLLKVIDRAPRQVVFILVCSRIDVLPHIVVSWSQKFFFTKLKDVDILCTLEQIASEEDLEIDRDALKLIASRSEGSLRDAEMTLEQLSLLGERISLCLVQELVGLISDEKLVDLLDLALSADTVNTVKNLRHIMESGVEPLTLMSQLATVITDILAGSYDVLKERPRRRFFQRKALSKEDMEKLRQALKTLSEAEKQLRVTNDRMTWLTAALLQLAPDQQYVDTSLVHSHLGLDNSVLKSRSKKSNGEVHTHQDGISGDVHNKLKVVGKDGKEHVGDSPENDVNKMDKVQLPGKFRQGIEEIWFEVLEEIPNNSLKEFMYQEGKLISLSYGAAPTVQLLFNSQLTKSDAEKFRSHILHAFETVLRSPVTIEIRCESRKPIILPPLQDHSDVNSVSLTGNVMHMTGHHESEKQNSENAFVGEMSTKKTHSSISFPNQRKLSGRDQSLAIVRRKATLAHVIQHGSLWSRRKLVSIAEKLEQENLRLEPRSRGVLCWNPPRLARLKLSRLKIRRRKPQTILKLVACGKCLPRSPR